LNAFKLLLAPLTFLACICAHADGLDINAQIHNAPGWRSSHGYTYSPGPPTAPFTRVVAGAGWTPTGRSGGTWRSGQPLHAYQLTSAGTCISASTGTGPSGTGPEIKDGSCTWRYVSPVDYISFTGWALDSGFVWASGTDYGVRQVVNTGTNSDVYQEQAAGCHSTVEPNNRTGTAFSTPDGCIWTYKGTIYYSSRAHPFPHEQFWWDHFKGYIRPENASFIASISNGKTMTVSAVSSGRLYKSASITGPGIAAAQSIWDQTSGTPGGPGTYALATSQADSPASMLTSRYGLLTVTTPPTTHPLVTNEPDIVSSPGMENGTGRANGDSYSGVRIIGSGGSSGTYAVTSAQTIGTAGQPTTLYHARILQLDYVYNDVYHAQLWNDREYVSGQNGELSPLVTWNHNYAYNDSVQPAGEHARYPASTATGRSFPFYIEAAPGESFADTLAANSKIPLAGYNIDNGVGLRGVGVAGLATMDNVIVVRRLQIASSTSSATNSPARACNICTFEGNILQGGSGGRLSAYTADAVSNCGYDCRWYNNLVIVRGELGIAADYGGRFYNNTIVCPSESCGSAMSNTWDWANHDGMVINGNAVFGFQYFTSTNYYGQGFSGDCTWNCSTVQGTNNASDLPPTNASDFPKTQIGKSKEYGLPFYTGAGFRAPDKAFKPICAAMPGGVLTPAKCQMMGSVSRSAAFAGWPKNLRPTPSGPLIGAGAAFGAWNWCVGGATLVRSGAGSWPGCMINPSDTDLLGSARPVAGRYDIGAVEYRGEVKRRGAGGTPLPQ